MLREPRLLVGPERVACLVVGVAVQAGLRVEGALVGHFQLIDGVVVDGFLFLGILGCYRGCQTAVGQTHEDAVEPHLVGVDGLVPEHLVGFGARLVLQLLHHGLHSQQVLLLGPLLVHAGDEVAGADVVEVIVQNVVAADVALSVDHRVGVLLTVAADLVAAVSEIGVEHTLQLDAHDVRPLRLR